MKKSKGGTVSSRGIRKLTRKTIPAVRDNVRNYTSKTQGRAGRIGSVQSELPRAD